MSARKINIGLLGLGRLGKLYAEYLSAAVSRSKLVAVADTSGSLAQDVAKKFGVEAAYSNPTDLMENSKVEAVVIATPTVTHAELIEAAVSRGKIIFCEKPLSLSLRESYSIQKTIERSGVFFQMGFMRRFDRGYILAKRQIENGVIGKPLVFKSTSRDPYPASLEYLHPKNSGGLLVDMGIHDFDLALWLMGRIRTVNAIGSVLALPELKKIGDVDNAIVSLTFEDGRLGVVDLCRNGVYGYEISTEILGSKGTLRIGYLRETPVLIMLKDTISYDTVPFFKERFGEAYVRQLQNFVDNVLTARSPPVTLNDGIQALKVGIAARLSCREGKAVEVNSATN